MKRLHMSFNVTDLEAAVGFYTTLFAHPPTLLKADYAQWMLDDPRVNFVLEAASTAGFGHAGIQAEDEQELADVFTRLQDAGAPYLPEGTTQCCYHQSEKSWTHDPDGHAWEAFHTHHETAERGAMALASPAPRGQCCG